MTFCYNAGVPSRALNCDLPPCLPFSESNCPDVLRAASQMLPEIVRLRRWFHKHPEVGFRETRSAEVARSELEKVGFKVRTGLAKTGLLADSGTAKLVAIRASMDALPIKELLRSDWASSNYGVMHACGHDAHMAIALCTAKLLSSETATPVRIIFQPGEDSPGELGLMAAREMIDRGALENVRALLGFHIDATLAPGKVLIVQNQSGGDDSFSIRLSRKPDANCDPLSASIRILQTIYEIAEKSSVDGDPVIHPVSINTSSALYSTPQGVVVECRIGRLWHRSREQTERLLRQVCAGVESEGLDIQLQLRMNSTSSDNSRPIVEAMIESAVFVLGEKNVSISGRTAWNRQFIEFMKYVPGAFLLAGARPSGRFVCHKTGNFDIDESSLHLTTAILADTVKRIARSNRV